MAHALKGAANNPSRAPRQAKFPRSLLQHVQVRRVQEGDMQGIIELFSVAWTRAPEERKRMAEAVKFTFEDLKRLIADGGEVLVAYLDRRLVGFGGLRKVDDTTFQLWKTRVHPDYQNENRIGLGEMLTEKREEFARAAGAAKFWAEPAESTSREIALLVKRGYRKISERDGENNLHFVLFEKSL